MRFRRMRMSDTQANLQSELVDRILSTKVNPRVDNSLAISTDIRKLALDARMLRFDGGDDVESKINQLVENVREMWMQSTHVNGYSAHFLRYGRKK
jgi:hypothetical protein